MNDNTRPEAPSQPPKPQPIEGNQPTGLQPRRRSRKKPFVFAIVLLFVAAIAAIGVMVVLYFTQLAPVSNDENSIAVRIEEGSTPEQIGNTLEENGVIRSATAFDIYTRLQGVRSSLQAGQYLLRPNESTQEIVRHLVEGRVDTFTITFLPGATLSENRTILLEAGFTEQEVDEALEATYEHPLLAGKPADTDLEGYIYGETYTFDSSVTVPEIITHSFDEFYSEVETRNIVSLLEAQGMDLYEGITLASIVQREVTAPDAATMTEDQQIVAQIFYTRLAEDTTLGSDVTYQYIADKLGLERDPDLDSPYNTRRYPGLPPGPIATPGVGALEAVAKPADTDYYFFISGDDDQTYFARTNEEHEANIEQHCQEKCQII